MKITSHNAAVNSKKRLNFNSVGLVFFFVVFYNFRSRHTQMFSKNGVVKNFVKFAEEHLLIAVGLQL